LLWVTRRDGGTIAAVDPRQRTLAALADTGLEHVDAITAASGGAWAIGPNDLVRVDASLGVSVRRAMPHQSMRADDAFGSVGTVATASGRLWLATSHGITILDAGTGRTLRRIVSGLDATAIAAAAGRIWAVSGPQARVVELDDRTGRTLLDLRLAGVRGPRAAYPYAIAAFGHVAWVLNGNTATLSTIDGDLGEVTSTTSIGVGSNPVGLAADARAAWVATSSEGAVIRVDAHTGVTRTFRVGFSPRGVAIGDGAVWVAVQAG
jgi:DNA-binding beta-propeller fold protein YncE